MSLVDLSVRCPTSGLRVRVHKLGIGRLLVKRDDLTAPTYGGNKVRELDYLLGKAPELLHLTHRIATVSLRRAPV